MRKNKTGSEKVRRRFDRRFARHLLSAFLIINMLLNSIPMTAVSEDVPMVSLGDLVESENVDAVNVDSALGGEMTIGDTDADDADDAGDAPHNLYEYHLQDEKELLLSDIIDALQLPFSIKKVEMTAVLGIETVVMPEKVKELPTQWLTVEPTKVIKDDEEKDDYLITVLADFVEASFAVYTADDSYTIKLVHLVASDVDAAAGQLAQDEGSLEDHIEETGLEAVSEDGTDTAKTDQSLFTYDLGGASEVLLSQVLGAVQLPIGMPEIEAAASLGSGDGGEEALSVLPEEGDYRITALRDFDSASLALYTAGGMTVVTLLNGTKAEEPAEPVAEAVDEPVLPVEPTEGESTGSEPVELSDVVEGEPLAEPVEGAPADAEPVEPETSEPVAGPVDEAGGGSDTDSTTELAQEPTEPVEGEQTVSEPVDAPVESSEPAEGEHPVGERVDAAIDSFGPVEGELVTVEPVDAEPVDAPIETSEPVEGELITGEPVDAEPVDAPVDSSEPVEGELVIGEPVDAEPVDAPIETSEPVEGELVTGEPIDAPVEASEPVEGELVSGEPIEGELVTGEPVDAPVDSSEPVEGELVTTEPVDETNGPAEPNADEPTEPTDAVEDGTAEPSEPVEGESTEPTDAIEDETGEPSEPVEGEITEPLDTAEDETGEPSEPVEGETTEPLDTAEDETGEASEPVEGETTEPLDTAEDETTESTEDTALEPAEPAIGSLSEGAVSPEGETEGEGLSEGAVPPEGETERAGLSEGAVSPEGETEGAGLSEGAVPPEGESEGTDQPGEAEGSDETDAPDADTDMEETPDAPAPVAYPPQEFTGRVMGVVVNVDAPEGAFPEGTTMKVRAVRDAGTLSGAADTVTEDDDFVEVKRVYAVDITFYNAAGDEIEPLQPISVVMAVAELADQQDATVVHVDDEGNTEIVEQSDAPASTDDGKLALNVEMPATEEASADTIPTEVEYGTETEAQEPSPLGKVDQPEAGTDEVAQSEDIADINEPGDEDTASLPADAETDPSQGEAIDSAEGEVLPSEEASEETSDEPTEGVDAQTITDQDQTEVAFEADEFSTYVIVITQTITTRYIDAAGNTWSIEVGYGPEAAIPVGAELSVAELTGDVADAYAAQAAQALEIGAEQVAYAKALDISILSNGEKVQPQAPVSVSVKLLDAPDLEAMEGVNVVHFPEETDVEAQIVDSSLNGEVVEFETDGFSVYIIIGHEGEEKVVMPRVEFHFLAEATGEPTEEDNIYYYVASRYYFMNKGEDPGNIQNSLIVRNGDKLESIEAPMNSQTSYFDGWYTVVRKEGDTDKDNVTYYWPDDTQRVDLDNTVSLEANENTDGSINWIKWTVNGITGTSNDVDAEGCAHVYLAPIYNNYHFVNFHLGARGTQTASTILVRKLIVLGNSQQRDIRIGDVDAPSEDPVHVVFVGWEYKNPNSSEWVFVRTIGDDGREIKDSGKDGTYLTVGAESVDLYPYFEQARWINFDLGPAGNGALYQGSQFILTSDKNDHPITQFGTTTRKGYTFAGWYLGKDDDGYGAGTQVTDVNGNILPGVTVTGYANSEGNIVYEPSEGYQTAFEIKEGAIRVYNALENLTLYATWRPAAEADYKVVIWKQKVTDAATTTNTPIDMANWLADHPNATEEDYIAANGPVKTYDFYAKGYSERHCSDTAVAVNPTSADLGYVTSNPDGEFTGFLLGAYDQNVMVDPQGSTVINVYYDRITYSLKFFFARRQVGNNGTETGNFYVPVLSGTFRPPQTMTWQAYCTQGSGMNWDNANTTSLSAVCGYDLSNIEHYREANYNYYCYVIKANYGSDIGDRWPDYSKFPVVGSRTLTSWWMMAGARLYGSAGQNDTVKGKVTIIDENILGQVNSADGNFLISSYRTSTPNNWTYNIYYECLDGVDYSDKTKETKDDGKVYYLHEQIFARSSSSQTNQQNAPAYTGFGVVTRYTRGNGNPQYMMYYYYSRDLYDMTFEMNYPATARFSENTETTEPEVIGDIPFGTVLTDYAGTAAPNAPDGYYFDGWYEDQSCTVEFDFSKETMPAADKIIYAKWALVEYPIHIDPNGGVIDHINYGDTTAAGLILTGLAGAGTSSYDGSKSTYFDNLAEQTIDEYKNVFRPYVEVSEAEAATMAERTVYRYVYTPYTGMEGGKDGKLGADARNAVYIYDTEESLDAYYNFYVAQVQKRNADKHYTGADALTPLPRALWENVYVSQEKYRVARDGENYVFLAWYKVVDGVRDAMPFDFSEPATEETTLQAEWRLDGGYSFLYTPDYYIENLNGGYDYITGNLEAWTDPVQDEGKYTDGALTHAMQEPREIMVNGVLDEQGLYQFRGWQIVRVTSVGNVTRYTALEPGVYYTAGQALTVKAKFADENMIIRMQAVYERRGEAYRRPEIINLTLDASKDADNIGQGYLNITDDDALPEWDYSGVSVIGEEKKTVDSSEQPYQILFSTVQSNAAVHLYQYATTLTQTETDPTVTLDPAGRNFFTHTEGYKLVGFDLDAEDSDYAPVFPADAVVSVSPSDAHTLYAVWEPMVYLTFVNDTDVGDVTFNLSGTEQSMYIVNKADGSFSRTPINPNQSITVPKGETLKLVLPYGAGATVTVQGTNTLGPGWMLNANKTKPTSGATLIGVPNNAETDYRKIKNNENFGFSDTLIVDPEGIVITFTADQSPHTLVLQDNYNKNGKGGNTVEVNFEETSDGTVYFINESDTSYELPSTGTRVGYEFIGWDPNCALNPKTNTPTYHGSTWTISDLTAFFGDEAIVTLYGIWDANADSGTVYIYKNVEGPVDKDNETFTFTVAFAGGFTYEQYEFSRWNSKTGEMSSSTGYGTTVMNKSFTLKHGEYLEIKSSKDAESGRDARPSFTVTIQKHEADDDPVGNPETLSWTWNHFNFDSTGNSYKFRNFAFSTSSVSIVETDPGIKFSVSEEIAAQTTENHITINEADRKASWNDFAGGTVIFHNTRATADVKIRKTLLPDTIEARPFSFTAEFTNGTDGSITTYEGYTLDVTEKNFLSGTGEWKIEGIPTGAKLKITETVDDELYETTHKIGSGDEQSGNSTTVTVGENTDVEFTNKLYKQKIRLVVIDDDDNPLDSALFNFPNVYSGTKYAAAGTGLVWEGEIYAGDYTLTETNMPNRLYQKLEYPVSISVRDMVEERYAVTATTEPDSDDVVNVTYDNVSKVYTIEVVNPKQMLVTVKKKVEGGSTSGSFEVTATLTKNDAALHLSEVINPGTASARGTDASGKISFTLVNDQSVVLYVPNGTRLVLAETPDLAYDPSYQIGMTANDLGTAESGGTATLQSVTQNSYVLFTNTLKTRTITVRNTIIAENTTDLEFGFTLTLLNVTVPIKDFLIHDDTEDDSKDLTTNAQGQVTFSLKQEETIDFKIPVGASVTLSETVMPAGQEDDFAVFITVPGGSENLISGQSVVYRLNAPDKDTVIRVFNISSICKVTDEAGKLLYVLQEGANTPYDPSDDIYIPAIFPTIKGAFNGRDGGIGGLGKYYQKGITTTYAEYSPTKQHRIEMLVDYVVPETDVVVVEAGYNMVFTTAKLDAGDGYPFRRSEAYGDLPDGVSGDESIGRAVLKRKTSTDEQDAFFTISTTGATQSTTFKMSDLIIDGVGAMLKDNVKGGCLTAYNADVTIDNCVICRFEAAEGGAVYTTGASLTVNNSVFDTCKSSKANNGNGGGAINTTADIMTISNSTFRKCEAVFQGGAVYQHGNVNGTNVDTAGKNKSATITNCSFIDCTSRAGGGVQADVGTVTVIGSTFENCIATADDTSGGNGGGLNNYTTDFKDSGFKSTMTLTGCIFRGCEANKRDGKGNGNGGGMRSDALTTTLTSCVFENDCKAVNGGGVALTNANGTATVSGGSFTGCTATTNGGGIYSGGESLTVKGTASITGCSAGSGGGVYTTGNLTLSDSVQITDNRLKGTTVGNAGGVYIPNGKTLTLGEDGTGSISVKVSDNTTSSGAVSNLRLSEIAEDGTFKGYNSNNSVEVRRSLGADCDIGVINPKVMLWQFGSSDGQKTGLDVENKRIHADDNSLYAGYGEGNNIIWMGDYICRITNSEGKTLCIRSGDYPPLPAVYSDLDTAFKNYKDKATAFSVYAGVSDTNKIPARIEMLIPSYQIPKSIAVSGIEEVLLTTAPDPRIEDAPKADPNTNFRFYPADEYTSCRLYADSLDKDSMFSVEGGANLTVSNIVFGGTNGNPQPKRAFETKGSANLTLGENATIQYIVNTNKYGNAIFVAGSSNVTLKNNARITGCEAKYGGAMYIKENSMVTVSDTATIEACSATENGGAIYVTGTSSILNISAGTIQNNKAKNGGGIRVEEGATVNISGGAISNNVATNHNGQSNGGAISIKKGSVTIDSGSITGNRATYTSDNNNAIYAYGGAIHVSGTNTDAGTLTINGGTISDNYVGNLGKWAYGGAISLQGQAATVTINGGTISGNRAITNSSNKGVYGGAIAVLENASLTLTGGTISGNWVENKGSNDSRYEAGAGIYLGCYKSGVVGPTTDTSKIAPATLYISGNPSFGGADTESSGIYTFTEGVGNLLETEFTKVENKYPTNGNQEYKKARQDIYLAGYSGKTAGSIDTSGTAPTGTGIVVTGNITSGVGAIWVWAEAGGSTHVENDHIHEGDQFAFHVKDSVSESSLNAFRNARVDADSGASIALYGVKNTQSGKESEVIWGTIGGSDVWFRKVDGFGEGLGGAGFTLYKTLDGAKNSVATDVVAIIGDQVTGNEVMSASTADTTADIEVGDVNFRAPVGIYYMKETTVPAGYANDNVYIVLVGSGNVTVPAPRTGDWDTTNGVLGNITQDNINSQRGKPTNGKYPFDSAVFLIDGTTEKAVANPDIAAFGLMNESAMSRKVILRKTDKDDYTPLEGAEFTIYRADKSVMQVDGKGADGADIKVPLQNLPSGNAGAFWIGRLPYGEYYMVETKGPTPFTQNGKTYTKPENKQYVFRVDENGVSQKSGSEWKPTNTLNLTDVTTP